MSGAALRQKNTHFGENGNPSYPLAAAVLCCLLPQPRKSHRYHPILRERTIILGRETNHYDLTAFIMPAIELSSPKRLGRTVVLGYCDISAAGIRECECTKRVRKLFMPCCRFMGCRRGQVDKEACAKFFLLDRGEQFTACWYIRICCTCT